MAGGALKYRHLNRTSSHRQALLRNLVTSLITHESIQTTWPKAKETQRLAEKLITLGKKNTNASRRRAEQILYEPLTHLPTLFTTLRTRYLHRPGGYTRVLRTEPRNRHHDQAPSAILELVDGPRDMRFAMTAKTLVKERATEENEEGGGWRPLTEKNVAKVTKFRPNGENELWEMVRRMESRQGGQGKGMGEGEGRPPWERWDVSRQRKQEEAAEARRERKEPMSWQEERDATRDPNTGRRRKEQSRVTVTA